MQLPPLKSNLYFDVINNCNVVVNYYYKYYDIRYMEVKTSNDQLTYIPVSFKPISILNEDWWGSLGKANPLGHKSKARIINHSDFDQQSNSGKFNPDLYGIKYIRYWRASRTIQSTTLSTLLRLYKKRDI